MAEAQQDRLGSLEIGRYISALMVVLTHFCGNIVRYGSGPAAHFFGWVTLPAPFAAQYFFVLSGFVMMTAHGRDFGKRYAVPNFWWRRACRIYPMYWVALAIVCIFLYPALRDPHLAFTMIALVPHQTVEFVSPGWTLRYEMAFYIGFGLCLLPYIGRVLLVLWVLADLWLWRPAALVRFLPGAHMVWLKNFSVHHAALFFAPFDFFFFAGLGAAAIRLPHAKAAMAAIAAGAAVLLITAPDYKWGDTYGGPLTPVPVGVGLGLMMLGLATLERCGVLRLGSYARKLGIMSYPLYILHIPLMLFIDYFLLPHLHFRGLGLFAFAALYLATILSVAAAAAFFIDRPLQRRLHRLRFLPGGRLHVRTAN